MKKEIVIQIFTGGYLEDKVTYQQIEDKLKPILKAGQVKCVIMGWSLCKELYEETIVLLKEYGVECFLWLPVFSETGLLKSAAYLVDDEGHKVKNYNLKDGESFEFYCPQNPGNIENFLEIYNDNFSGIDFDGVFLDKIRYGAFSNGISGVFSCFCDICMDKYRAWGLDTEELIAEMGKVRRGEEGYGTAPLQMKSYKNGEYQFQNKIWKLFFEKKRDSITEVLTGIVEYFHHRDMLVGMDTFSPFTAYFAGQDVAELGKLADFIKPMMYRITNAPAGLPFEADCLVRETSKVPTEAKAAFYQIIGCQDTGNAPFDIGFVQEELKYLTDKGIPVYGGVEINRNEAAPAAPYYIRENLRALGESDIDGFVLSWDLLSAPAENIAEIIEYLQQRR